MSAMNEAKPVGIMVRIADLELVRKALFDAMDDMREYQQVARFNLTGEFLSQQMERPDPPLLIHQHGINETDARLSNCQAAAVLLNQWTDTLPPKACRMNEVVESVQASMTHSEFAPCSACGHPTVWWPHGLCGGAKCENCQREATPKV